MTNRLKADRDRFAAANPEQRADLHGRDWGYVDLGAGPALLLLPGTLGRCDIFWQQIEALADRLRLVSVSYPDSGGIAEWTGDLLALMDRLELSGATILGTSLGGYLAQYIAGTAEDRVEGLIAANTLHSVVGLDARAPYSLDLERTPIAQLRDGFGGALRAWREDHPGQADLVDLLLAEVGGRVPGPELRRRLAVLKHAPSLPEVGLPPERVFTVDAEDDPLIPPETRQAVRDRLAPGIAFHFRDGGHFPYLARPADYTALIEETMGLETTGAGWGSGAERVR